MEETTRQATEQTPPGPLGHDSLTQSPQVEELNEPTKAPVESATQEAEPRSEPPAQTHQKGEAQSGQPQEEVDWKDRYLRLAADFDNHRKRTREEMRLAQRRELTAVLSDWLDVYDSTLRALESATDTKSEWFAGLDAIRRQMDQALARRGVKRLEMEEEARFDPRYHEAVAVIPAPAADDGKILHTERAGFVFSDGEVLRAARVVVAKSKG